MFWGKLRYGLFTIVIAVTSLISDIDPNILELGKRYYGESCELVKQTEWSYTYKCGDKQYCRISRFLAENGFEVSASDVKQRWPTWAEHERLSAIYLALVAGLAMLAAFINVVVFKNWVFSASRSVWLVLNAGVFLAASALAWRILYARHLG